jgi:hypothetical protein
MTQLLNWILRLVAPRPPECICNAFVERKDGFYCIDCDKYVCADAGDLPP